MNRRENNSGYQQITHDIYVGNVPKSLTENDLKQLFINYGEIKQVLCRWKEDNPVIGYAIVKYVYKADAEKLLSQTNEMSWNGHPLPIKAARRSDQNQYNGNPMAENKSNYYPDLNPKPLFMNPPFLKGGPGDFYPSPNPFPNNHIKRHSDDYLMSDFGYFHQTNYQEDQNVHSVPLMLEVLCTNAEDAITFYGCPVHRFDELSNVIHALSCINLTQNTVDKKPLPKKVYAALFSEDRSWYRCTVSRTSIPNKPGMCTVRYIDYGNSEDTAYRNVVELPESLQKVPPFASKFVFSNLMCESKSNKQTYLHQLTNKRMSLCAVLSPVGSEYQVLKCSCNGKDVISETVKKGFASFKKVQKPVVSKPTATSTKSKSKSHSEGPDNRKNKPVCNGSNELAPEIQENGNARDNFNNSKGLRKGAATKNKENVPKKEDINCNEICEDLDFHPKMIIKRGSDINDIVKCKVPPEIKKEKEPKLLVTASSVCNIDAVIANLKLINNIRALVSQSTDDSIIQCAVEILQSEAKALELPENANLSCVNDMLQSYIESLNKIKQCTDKVALSNLKLDRDAKRKMLCDKLKHFLENFNTSIFGRKKIIQQTITDLASNSNDWMNVELNAMPENIEDLILQYNNVKEERWNLVRKAREKTNEKHKGFMEVFTSLEKDFYLNTLEGDSSNCESNLTINSDTKRTTYSSKFDEALNDLGKAVDEEIHTLTLTKTKNTISIIQYLLAQLDIHKEKVESVCELYESKLSMYNDLCKSVDVDSYLLELDGVQEEVCKILVSLSEDNVTPAVDLTTVIRHLHTVLLKEDSLMETLAKASEAFLPELSIEHPDLKLSEYYQSKFLLKYNWKPDYFLISETIWRGKPSYLSKLLDDPVVIKEYKRETKEDMARFLHIAITWNSCKCEFLLKMIALFFKNENTICSVCPLTTSSLLESPPGPMPFEGEKACQILRQVLICLKELHSQKVVYGTVHPFTVLLEKGKVLLDFCFDPKALEDIPVLKGINFCPPNDEVSQESGDMYGFGCLVLWLLFPNLSFTTADDGVPNIGAFRSIIEEVLTAKDYALLFPLICSKTKKRPSASLLLNKGFLSNYESYCRSRNKVINSS